MQTTNTRPPLPLSQLVNAVYCVTDSLRESEDQHGYAVGIEIDTLYRVAEEIERHIQQQER